MIDTAADYPGTILGSALWHMEPTVDHAIAAVKAGEFKAEDYGKLSYMKPGGGTVVLDSALLPEGTVAEVDAKQAEILDGSFTVKVNDEEPKSSM